MEFKKADAREKVNLESLAQSVIKQIEEKKYAVELLERGASNSSSRTYLNLFIHNQNEQVFKHPKHI